MKTIATIILAALLCGCASGTRLNISEVEMRSHFEIQYQNSPESAFDQTEMVLARTYNDYKNVLQLRQPATKTLILKPLLKYYVGGAIGDLQHAPYTLSIRILDGRETLDFELQPDVLNHTWAPKTEIPKIKTHFRAIAQEISRGLGGELLAENN